MIYVKKYTCNECGDIFILKTGETKKCKCGKSNIINCDYFTTYSTQDGSGLFFEGEVIDEYLEEHEGIYAPKVVELYNKCKEISKDIEYSHWYETKKKVFNSNDERIDYISFNFSVSVNSIESNYYEFTLKLTGSKYELEIEKQIKRFENLLFVLEAYKSEEYDFSLRQSKNKINTMQELSELKEDLEWDASERDLGYKDVAFYI